MPCSKFHSYDSQILGTTVQNLFDTAQLAAGVHFWNNWWIRLAVSLIDKLNLRGFGTALHEKLIDMW
jgi:hypothetical protein